MTHEDAIAAAIEELDGGFVWAARYDDAGKLLEVVKPNADGTITLGPGSWWLRVRTLYDQRTAIPLEVKP